MAKERKTNVVEGVFFTLYLLITLARLLSNDY